MTRQAWSHDVAVHRSLNSDGETMTTAGFNLYAPRGNQMNERIV